MLAARSAVSLTKSLVGMNGFQMRNSAISGPPRVKVSGAVSILYSWPPSRKGFNHRFR